MWVTLDQSSLDTTLDLCQKAEKTLDQSFSQPNLPQKVWLHQTNYPVAADSVLEIVYIGWVDGCVMSRTTSSCYAAKKNAASELHFFQNNAWRRTDWCFSQYSRVFLSLAFPFCDRKEKNGQLTFPCCLEGREGGSSHMSIYWFQLCIMLSPKSSRW